MSFISKRIAQQLRNPSNGFWCFITRKMILDKNGPLEVATFNQLQVKSSDSVLELGFGFGLGLSHALNSTLRGGNGKLYGVDYSLSACESVKEMLKKDVQNGKIEIFHCDVGQMPIADDSIDKAFHTNCFYFWSDMPAATSEIKRVLKPGGVVVAGLNMNGLKRAENKGLLEEWQFQPERYMDAMNNAGFTNVHKIVNSEKKLNANFTFVHATKPL